MRPSSASRGQAGGYAWAALLLLVASCSGSAAPGDAGTRSPGERAEALDAAAVSTGSAAAGASEPDGGTLPEDGRTAPAPGTTDAVASGAAAFAGTGPEALRPEDEAANAEPAASQHPEPGPSPSAPTTTVPAVRPDRQQDTEPHDTGQDDTEPDDTEPDDTEPDDTEPDDADEKTSLGRVWIVDDDEDAAPLAAAARQVGVEVVAAAGDLRALPRSARAAISAASQVDVLANLGDDAAWQLEVVRRGEELPGGGLLLFEPGDDSPTRRLVAAYGHPSTASLGVLGEQGPEEAVERLQSMVEGYGADGSAVLPVFEIIATVASASAGADGDYSSMAGLDAIRPWIEAAAANGVYVVLDLQPGRSDFLSQAKHYEEFLRLPHVGLALDPEWRLKPNQVHLAQIGTVDAAEVNRVVDWLAGIVREEALPQKLLIVHQFRFSMITDREKIETPPELAVLIHMDGQGSLTSKYGTWNALTGQPDADRFYWGWKNFYDEDRPMANPEQVLELSPKIVFVSFQ